MATKRKTPRPISDELRRLVKERMAAGITRYQIAEAAGLPHSTLYLWLVDPDSHGAGSTLDRIAAYLGAEIGVPREKTEKNLAAEPATQ